MSGDQADNVCEELSINNLFPNSSAVAVAIYVIGRRSSLHPVVSENKSKLNHEGHRTWSAVALPLTDEIGPLVDHQASSTLKDKVASEQTDAVIMPSGSGAKVPKRKWAGSIKDDIVLTRFLLQAAIGAPPAPRRKLLKRHKPNISPATSAQSVGRVDTSLSPPAVVVTTRTLPAPSPPSLPAISSVPGADKLAEACCLLEMGTREMLARIERLGKVASSSDGCVVQLESQLAEAREDLQKMKDLVAGHEQQRQGLETRMV
uniref:Uncharacterized protein n=1 Tax=Oryza sativa subsp. japonica TaxID=39947 RepID=Q6Z0E1_ORYSJ|nr:hypothetical protein [Oryza sativa Japonica Group]BAD03667.1 hypothetical protein [Oryza sativa Japonica Group]